MASSNNGQHKQDIHPPPDGGQHGVAYHQHPPPRYQHAEAIQKHQHQHQPVQYLAHHQPHYQYAPQGGSTGNEDTSPAAAAQEHYAPRQVTVPAGHEVRYYVPPQPTAQHLQQQQYPTPQITYQYDPSTMAYQPCHPPNDAYPPPPQYQQQPAVQQHLEGVPPSQMAVSEQQQEMQVVDTRHQYPQQPREEEPQQQQHNQQQQTSFVIRGSAACVNEVQHVNTKEDDSMQMVEPTPVVGHNQMLPPMSPVRPGKTVVQPINKQPNHNVNATRKRKVQEEDSTPVTDIPTTENTKEAVSKYEQVNQQESFAGFSITATEEANDNEKFPFTNIMTTLQTYQAQHHSLSIPKSDPTFTKIVNNLVMNGIEEESDALWESYFAKLKDCKDRAGDCDVPVTDQTLGQWVKLQRRLYAKFHPSTTTSDANDDANCGEQLNPEYTTRFNRLSSIGFDFTTPLWDVRYQELVEYKAQHNNVTPLLLYNGCIKEEKNN